jgi:micrococcal nuclease
VLIDGVSNRVRIYRADTPETQNEQHCGGEEATAFVELALGFNDTPGTVYLERDENERDRYGRELAYLWFEIDGLPYLLNHALINNGWAEDVDYGDRLYDEQFQEAAAFAERHELGVYELCGAFGMALNDTQSQPVVREPAASGVQEPVVPVQTQPTGCDPNYTPCIPAYPPDLNCPDIGMTVQVIGADPHGLDRDKDGLGCE